MIQLGNYIRIRFGGKGTRIAYVIRRPRKVDGIQVDGWIVRPFNAQGRCWCTTPKLVLTENVLDHRVPRAEFPPGLIPIGAAPLPVGRDR